MWKFFTILAATSTVICGVILAAILISFGPGYRGRMASGHERILENGLLSERWRSGNIVFSNDEMLSYDALAFAALPVMWFCIRIVKRRRERRMRGFPVELSGTTPPRAGAGEENP
jgi:hypothetical protein